MTRSKYIFAFLFFLLQSLALSKDHPCDTTAVISLVKRSRQEISRDLDLSERLAREAYGKAQPCKTTFAYYEAVLCLAGIYNQKDLYDSVIGLLTPVFSKLPAATPKKYLAAFNHRLGSAYLNTMELEKSMSHNLSALKNYEACNDSTNISYILSSIANIYRQQGNFNQAIRYFRQAQSIAERLSNKKPLGNVYNSIGILYAENSQSDTLILHPAIDSAEKYFLLSTAVREKVEDKNTVVWNYNNLGGLYIMMRKLKPASIYLEKAMKIFTETGNAEGQMDVANNLGELYMQLKEDDKALYYYSYSRRLHSQTNNPDNLENLYFNLLKYYKLKGDAKTALIYSDSLMAIKDTLYGHQLDSRIAEMQVKYDTEKKDLEIARNKAELQIKDEQALIRNGIIIGITILLLLLILLGILFYRKKQVEQRARLDAEIIRQKDLRTKSIMETEEKERIRIAKDLHDGIGQLLSAAKMNLSSLEGKIEVKGPDQQSALKNAVDLLDESVKEVRTVSHNMMPNVLLKLGLASAVKEFITKIQSSPDLKVKLEIVGMNERLAQEMESILYRTIQEVVSNIIKHAKASELGLQLIRHEKELSIIIEDNGIGFDTSRLNDFNGIGLKNIISRVEFINGKIFFDSTVGKGTTVVIDVPLS